MFEWVDQFILLSSESFARARECLFVGQRVASFPAGSILWSILVVGGAFSWAVTNHSDCVTPPYPVGSLCRPVREMQKRCSIYYTSTSGAVYRVWHTRAVQTRVDRNYSPLFKYPDKTFVRLNILFLSFVTDLASN